MRTILIPTLLALVAAPTFAGEAGEKPKRPAGGEDRPSREELLKKYDANGDGKLDDTERAALRKDMEERVVKEAGERFEAADANKDGKLDKPEFAAHLAKRREERGERGGDRPKGDRPKPKGDGDGKPKGDGDKPKGEGKPKPTPEEQEERRRKMVDALFERADTSQDGAIDKTEFIEAAKRMIERGREGREGRGDGENRPKPEGGKEKGGEKPAPGGGAGGSGGKDGAKDL